MQGVGKKDKRRILSNKKLGLEHRIEYKIFLNALKMVQWQTSQNFHIGSDYMK